MWNIEQVVYIPLIKNTGPGVIKYVIFKNLSYSVQDLNHLWKYGKMTIL